MSGLALLPSTKNRAKANRTTLVDFPLQIRPSMDPFTISRQNVVDVPKSDCIRSGGSHPSH
jgi:hypothetical protein